MSGSDRPPTKRKKVGSDVKLAELVVQGRTIESAAREAGMSEPTARRRLKEPDVVDLMKELRLAQFTAAADRLASIAAGAAWQLGKLIVSDSSSDSVKVRAISICLRESMRLRSEILLEDRLAAVERAIEAERRVREAQGQYARLHAVPGGQR